MAGTKVVNTRWEIIEAHRGFGGCSRTRDDITVIARGPADIPMPPLTILFNKWGVLGLVAYLGNHSNDTCGSDFPDQW